MICLFKRTSVIVLALVLGLSALAFAPGAQAADYGWNYEGGMPDDRTSFLSVQLPNGSVFVSMGFDVDGFTYQAESWLFDPATGDWTARADSPYKAVFTSGAYLNGRVYVFGGYTSASVQVDSVLIYDLEADTWSVTQDLPDPLQGMACAAVDDRNILVAGGDQDSSWGFDECYLFNIDTEVFTPVDSLPEGRCSGSMVLSDGKAYYIGGWDSLHVPQEEVFVYDVLANQWTLFTQLPAARAGMAAVISTNDLVYLIGGSSSVAWSNDDNLVEVLTLNLVSGQFGRRPPLPEQTKYGAAIAANDSVYFFGGHDGGAPRSEIYSLENIRARAELTDPSVEQGTALWIRVWVETEMEFDSAIHATVYIMQGNTSYGIADLSSGQGDEAYVRIPIPEDMPVGQYTIESYWASLGVGWEVVCPLETMTFTVVAAPSVDDRLDELQNSNEDLQDQLDTLKQELNNTRAELKEATDAKLDAMIGYVILILVIVVLVVAVISLIRKR